MKSTPSKIATATLVLNSAAVLFSSSAVAAPARAVVQSEPMPPQYPLQLDNATVDEALFAVAKAGKVNIIADATDWPDDDKTLTTEYTDSVMGWLGGLANEFDLTINADGKGQLNYLSNDSKNFVLWHEPQDIEPILQQARQTYTAPSAPTDTEGNALPQSPEMSDATYKRYSMMGQAERARQQVVAWLEAQGVDKTSLKAPLDYPASQLPAPLRDTLRQLARVQLTNLHSGPNGALPAVVVKELDDETWKNAYLIYERTSGRRLGYVSSRQQSRWPNQRFGRHQFVSRQTGGSTMRFSLFYRVSRSIGLAGASLLMTTSAHAQQANVQTTTPVATVSAANGETIVSWRDKVKLGAKITLQAKRQPLSEVLATLSAQSGIALDGGELATTKRVTLSVRDMELRDAMASLEELYQADWQVQGENQYQLRPRTLLPWQRTLAQLGNLSLWGYYRTDWSRPFAPPYLTAEYAFDWEGLLKKMDIKAVSSPEGVPLSTLPPELQAELRRISSWRSKLQAVRGFARSRLSEAEWSLHIRPVNYPIFLENATFKPPIPEVLGPPIGEIVSNNQLLASFALTQNRIFAPEPEGPLKPGRSIVTR